MTTLYFKVVEWLTESNPNNQLVKPVRSVDPVDLPGFRFANAMSPLARISAALLSLVALLIGLLVLSIALGIIYFVWF